ncbi:MAG: AAA family ATPase [Gammaproteobacteria bacterium]
MYQHYFGLKEAPFSLSPDTDYFFAYGHYAQALNTLLVGLKTGEGFIKVTGEVGTGKTLMCRKLLNALGDDYQSIYLPNPLLSPYGLQVAVAEELGVEITHFVHRLQRLVSERLIALTREGKKIVLCVDEVQAMPDETLEALRLMTNLETEKRKLLQVVMFGQPELDTRLEQTKIRQLKQRITFAYNIEPIDRDGMRAYVQHRLSIAGYTGSPLFADKALELIYRNSRGIPRLINIMCHKSLMACFGKGHRQVTVEHARLAIDDTRSSQQWSVKPLHRWRWLGGSMTAMLLVAVTWITI